MPEDPTVIKELDLLLQTGTITHESIFEIRRELIASDAEGAAKTLAELKSELGRIKVDAESLLDRQQEIAARMDSIGTR